jgi:hypothetical protein
LDGLISAAGIAFKTFARMVINHSTSIASGNIELSMAILVAVESIGRYLG